MSHKKDTVEWWADWLVDAVAGATQNRSLLRGDPEEDENLTEALYLNAKRAIEKAMEANTNNDQPRFRGDLVSQELKDHHNEAKKAGQIVQENYREALSKLADSQIEICSACNGSGDGAHDLDCWKCGGYGGQPIKED